jgi:hypothetical protein
MVSDESMTEIDNYIPFGKSAIRDRSKKNEEISNSTDVTMKVTDDLYHHLAPVGLEHRTVVVIMN